MGVATAQRDYRSRLHHMPTTKRQREDHATSGCRKRGAEAEGFHEKSNSRCDPDQRLTAIRADGESLWDCQDAAGNLFIVLSSGDRQNDPRKGSQ